MKGTCLNCTERYPACHDHCEKYQTALREHLETRKKRNKEMSGEYDIIRLYSDRKAKKIKKYGNDLW